MKKLYKDYLKIASEVALDVLVGALVFYIIHFVFSMPIIWIGIVFVLSCFMRIGDYKKGRS